MQNSNPPGPKTFFTIIIPTYNREALIKRALDSLVAQTETDWEAIIVDDGSTDNTYSAVLPYLGSGRVINYLKLEHRGEAHAKNAGVMKAGGKFIGFLDSDDEYSPEHLQSRKAILVKQPSIRFLYGGVRIIGNPFVPDRFDPRKRIHLRHCVMGGAFIIERKTLVELNGFKDMLLGTDSDLFERAKQAGVAMEEVTLPTYIYHHENPDSVTNSLLSELT